MLDLLAVSLYASDLPLIPCTHSNLFGKFSSLINSSNLKNFKNKLDPRLYNGAIFIGLDAPVVKSHGGTDYFGFSNSIDVCNKIVRGNLIDKINENID